MPHNRMNVTLLIKLYFSAAVLVQMHVTNKSLILEYMTACNLFVIINILSNNSDSITF